jgi:hypothetical protein
MNECFHPSSIAQRHLHPSNHPSFHLFIYLSIQTDHPILRNRTSVTCNHFDIDGYLSVLCMMYPQEAMRNAAVLRMTARIGDFREYVPVRTHADLGLKLCCVINALERQHFARPFETHDDEKWPYFLNEVCVL